MKTNNLTKLKVLNKVFKGLLIAVGLITTVVACGGNKTNNQNLNAYQQSCSNCQNITGYPFFTVQTTAQNMTYYGNQLRLSLNFSGQNVSQSQMQSGANGGYVSGSPAMMYSGQVAAMGEVTVNSAIRFGNCPEVPAGQYTLSTQTVGTWNGNGYQAQISGLRLITTNGPVTFTLVMSNAYASEMVYAYSSSTSLNGNLQIETVNGLNCFGTQYYMGNNYGYPRY